MGVREPDLGGGGVGAAVGLLRGGRGGAAGVRGGRRAQAAGEKAAHERGGRRVSHQAAAGCGHGAGGESESEQGNLTRSLVLNVPSGALGSRAVAFQYPPGPPDALRVPCPRYCLHCCHHHVPVPTPPLQPDAKPCARGGHAAVWVGLLRGRAPDPPRLRSPRHQHTCQTPLPTPPRELQCRRRPCPSPGGPPAPRQHRGDWPHPTVGSLTFSPGPPS